MASPRITKAMREGIVRNTINEQFKAEREAIAKREHKLADRIYNQQYTKKQVDTMKELGSKFVDFSGAVFVNINGKSINLSFGGADSRGVHKNASWSRYAPDAKLAAEVESYIDDKVELDGKVQKAEIALMAMLESVQSFKKLRAVWPQGEKFYDMYDVDSETKAGVPAVVVTELNNLLGIK